MRCRVSVEQLVEERGNVWFSDKFTTNLGDRSVSTPARRVNLPKSTASRKTSALTFLIGELNTRIGKSVRPVRQLGALTTPPLPVAFTSVSYHSPFPMAHRRRQLMGVCAARRGRVPLQPHDTNQRPPAQKVDLMVSSVTP